MTPAFVIPDTALPVAEETEEDTVNRLVEISDKISSPDIPNAESDSEADTKYFSEEEAYGQETLEQMLDEEPMEQVVELSVTLLPLVKLQELEDSLLCRHCKEFDKVVLKALKFDYERFDVNRTLILLRSQFNPEYEGEIESVDNSIDDPIQAEIVA